MANLENNNVSSISNNEIRLYPNPASSDVILQTETPLNSAILTVKNYLGQTVIEMINLKLTFSCIEESLIFTNQ
jgi:hypothetical protein